jgi:hypothetical protein
MWPARTQRCRSLRARRLCVAVVLVAYCVTALGVPISAAVEKDHSQPFPCQDHACGCRTADDCWGQCCCFPPGERLAWASSRGLQVPPQAIRLSNGWDARPTPFRPAAERERAGCHFCSEDQSATSLPVRTDSDPAHECPDGGRACQDQLPSEDSAIEPSPTRGWVTGVAALRCRGVSTLWVSAGAVLPPPALEAGAAIKQLPQLLCGYEPSLLSISVAPPDPPPRVF